jgi:alcohol dehydrogenase
MTAAAVKLAELHFPPMVVFGQGAIERVGPLARGWSERALLVTDHGLRSTGLVDGVADRLRAAGVETTVYDGVVPNPAVAHVEAGLAAGAGLDIGVIVSVGGGSAHDCAKMIALVATNGGRVRDYEGVDRSPHRALPLIAVNTTSGSGAEVSRYAVITDPDRSLKMIVADRHLTPRVAINDPLTTLGLPAPVTMATGLDALTHAIEAYVSTAASEITDLLALRAVELAVKHLPRAIKHGQDIEAREAMMLAALLAGLAIDSALVGAVHALAHALGALYDLPHGVCNGMLLPAVVEWNFPAAAERYGRIAALLERGRPGRALPGMLQAFGDRVGLPRGLAALGVTRSRLPELAERAMADLCMTTNPRPMSTADVIRAYERAL